MASRPRTRSRANSSVTKKGKVTESVPVTHSVRDDVLSPSTDERNLQPEKFVGDGSMAAFLQLRQRQKLEQEASAKARVNAELDVPTETDPPGGKIQ